jgi:hypothetical protein
MRARGAQDAVNLGHAPRELSDVFARGERSTVQIVDERHGLDDIRIVDRTSLRTGDDNSPRVDDAGLRVIE